jgi:hypothetical protein
MKTEGSLPLLQEPSICSYPEAHQYSQYHSTLSLQDPPTYVLVFLLDSSQNMSVGTEENYDNPFEAWGVNTGSREYKGRAFNSTP